MSARKTRSPAISPPQPRGSASPNTCGIDLVVCSHRGPFVYERTSTGFRGARGGGGLIGAVAPVVQRCGGTWIAATFSEGDRERAEQEADGWPEADGYRMQLLELPSDAHHLHYDVVSNEYLWFLFHYLFDIPHEPVFDERFGRAWEAYERVNELYAEAVIRVGRTDAVLVQDYHLMLVGAELRRRRVRRPLLYFHHTPWCDPEYFGIFPAAVGEQMLRGLLAFDVVTFHARRWADAFRRCCERYVPGCQVTADVVTLRGRETKIVVSPVPLDMDQLTADASADQTVDMLEWVERVRAGRKMLLRVDRIDLSKNPLRGFLAFERLLEQTPEVANDVLFLALLYPSRLNVDSYRRYFADCLRVVRRVNDRFDGKVDADEGPIALHFQDDLHRSLAAMRLHDALLVNPVFDGLNLVAKEGSAINERSGSLLLSRNAGVFEEIGPASIALQPFDVEGTADAIRHALDLPAATRERGARRLRKLATASTPVAWIDRQFAAAGLR